MASSLGSSYVQDFKLMNSPSTGQTPRTKKTAHSISTSTPTCANCPNDDNIWFKVRGKVVCGQCGARPVVENQPPIHNNNNKPTSVRTKTKMVLSTPSTHTPRAFGNEVHINASLNIACAGIKKKLQLGSPLQEQEQQVATTMSQQSDNKTEDEQNEELPCTRVVRKNCIALCSEVMSFNNNDNVYVCAYVGM